MGRRKIYTDEEALLRRRYIDFRSQKIEYGHDFQLTIEEYSEFMRDAFINPTSKPKALRRIDPTKPWTKDNCEVRNQFMKDDLPDTVDDAQTKVTYYNRVKNQAKRNNEEFTLTLDRFVELWEEHWYERGLGSASYRMTRNDPTKPWDNTNTIITCGPNPQAKQPKKKAKKRKLVIKENKSPLTFKEFVRMSKETRGTL